MRSWPELGFAALLAGSCQGKGEPSGACPDDSQLTWTTFGEPFMRSWCTGCHSSTLPEDARQGAPLGMDFDTLQGVRDHRLPIRHRALDQRDMPPAGGPGEADLARLEEWLTCGAPGVDGPADTSDTGAQDTGASECTREGRWVLSGATCGGTNTTDNWLAMFPSTELVITQGNGTCNMTFRRADSTCAEEQAWRSSLQGPVTSFTFLGTTSCEPVACSWGALPDDTCIVLADLYTQDVAVVDLPNGAMAIGPINPPDLAPFCTNLGLSFLQVE